MSRFKSLMTGVVVTLLGNTAVQAASCPGRVTDPLTDVCWSCLFPVKLAGKVPLTGGNGLSDPDTGVPSLCACGKGTNLRAGITMSFWEPVRTVEIVRHAGCLPTLGGVNLGDLGLRVPDHVKVSSKTSDGSMRRNTAFWQVHWYITPWLFILEGLLDSGCLEQSAWDMAYLSELDPLWDDNFASFVLSPEAVLFANPAAQAACAADCVAANVSTATDTLYWCSGCQGSVFPLTGWTASAAGRPSAWALLAHRFAMKLSREGLLWSAHGKEGLCGPYFQPLMQKRVWRLQFLYPVAAPKTGGRCCQPLGASTLLSGSMASFSPGGEDGAVLLWRKRDCCATTDVTTLKGSGK